MNELIKDLGLTYEQAAHGVQTGVAHRMQSGLGGKEAEPKHMRTGIDLSKADQFGLACLLIDKGIITQEEYLEYMRLGVNTELARMEEAAHNAGFLNLSFR
jgi:hypothetical protein